MKIAYLAIYPPGTAPSQRFRIEQFLPYWEEMSIDVQIFPFYSQRSHKLIYKKGKLLSKVLWISLDILSRFLLLFKLKSYTIILIQRATIPIGPPLLEWMLKKILGKKIIYDFDDAIWIPTAESSNLVRTIKSYGKVKRICRWADQVVVGNAYLAQYARKYSQKVQIMPTVVDTEKKYLPQEESESKIPTIGWTGSHTTMKYLDLIIPSLFELQKTTDFTFKVISNKKPDFTLPNLEFVKWSEENEILELNSMNVGMMPLTEDPWSKGKCGFKAIQYMAMGIPAVVSSVGVNSEIVDHEVNGFIVDHPTHWKSYLTELLDNPKKANEMGIRARKKITEKYSVQSVLPLWQKIFHAFSEGIKNN